MLLRNDDLCLKNSFFPHNFSLYKSRKLGNQKLRWNCNLHVRINQKTVLDNALLGFFYLSFNLILSDLTRKASWVSAFFTNTWILGAFSFLEEVTPNQRMKEKREDSPNQTIKNWKIFPPYRSAAPYVYRNAFQDNDSSLDLNLRYQQWLSEWKKEIGKTNMKTVSRNLRQVRTEQSSRVVQQLRFHSRVLQQFRLPYEGETTN